MTILLMAGTSEAKDIATGLAAMGVPAVASLAGATRAPHPLAIATRVGGYGDADGFRTYLKDAGIHAVIDATHPFADRITARTAAVCAGLNMPYVYVLRPPWTPQAGDYWTQIASEQEAAAHIPKGATVFLGTGRQTLHQFDGLVGCRVICRQIDPPTAPFPFAGGMFLTGRPPFAVAAEKATFARLGVDWIVVKNAGGDASATKLTAARDLGIPVLMITRPAPPKAVCVNTVADALNWVRAL